MSNKTDHISPKPKLTVRNGRWVVSSLAVAEQFGKLHKDVLRTIKQNVLELAKLASKADATQLFDERKIAPVKLLTVVSSAGFLPQFCERNFELVDYSDARGEVRPMYFLTEEGFNLIAMGFTGEAALEWKVRYISAFAAMRSELKVDALGVPRRKGIEVAPGIFDDAETFLTAYYSVDADRNAAHVLWWFTMHYGYGGFAKVSYRRISEDMSNKPAKSGVRSAIDRLIGFRLVAKQEVRGRFFYKIDLPAVKAFLAKGGSMRYMPGLSSLPIENQRRIMEARMSWADDSENDLLLAPDGSLMQ